MTIPLFSDIIRWCNDNIRTGDWGWETALSDSYKFKPTTYNQLLLVQIYGGSTLTLGNDIIRISFMKEEDFVLFKLAWC